MAKSTFRPEIDEDFWDKIDNKRKMNKGLKTELEKPANKDTYQIYQKCSHFLIKSNQPHLTLLKYYIDKSGIAEVCCKVCLPLRSSKLMNNN